MTIHAPLERVFELFTDFEWSARHLHKAIQLDFHSENRSGLGAEWTQIDGEEGEHVSSRHKVTDFNPPGGYSMTSDDKAAFETMDFRFVQQNDGTLAAFDLTIEPKGFFKGLFLKVLKGAVYEAMSEDLHRIKAAIEDQMVSELSGNG